MKKIVFATNNKHKVEEISQKLKGFDIQLLTLSEIGCNTEIPEDYDTLEANARQKARFIYDQYRLDCIADDTGLEVEALNGKPGVFSARYSIDEAPTIDESLRSQFNIAKLLREMNNKENRRACFRTVICYIESGVEHFFEGKVCGQITHRPAGDKGFGYDPVFIPDGYSQTFAQMDLSEKNKISHRAMAIEKFISYLLQKSE